MNFYFFDVTNAQQFTQNSTVRPHVRQIGPYVYREVRNKSDVEFINDGTTLRYRQQKWFVFDAKRSCGSENDTFTHINIPLVVSRTYQASSHACVSFLTYWWKSLYFAKQLCYDILSVCLSLFAFSALVLFLPSVL